MTSAFHTTDSAPARLNEGAVPSPVSRLLLVLIVAAAAAAGLLATPAEVSDPAVSHAGADLVRLMRFMAALKGLMAVGATLAVLWRLGAPVTRAWLLAYGMACAAMAAGPGLIWAMAYVGTGALLLHGGLLASLVLLWRDPKVAGRLDAALIARRRR